MLLTGLTVFKNIFFIPQNPLFAVWRSICFFERNLIALWHQLMGCVLGESQGGEGAHRTSITHWRVMCPGLELGRSWARGRSWCTAGGQEEDDKKDLLHTQYCYVFFVVWVEGWVYTDRLIHTARIAYICIHVNGYVLFFYTHTQTRQIHANSIPKEIIHAQRHTSTLEWMLCLTITGP